MSGRLITNLCGLVIGVAIVAGIILGNLRSIQHLPYWPVWVAICLLLGGLIGYAVASFAVVRLYRLVHDSIRRMNVTDVIAAVVGLTLGLIIAALLTLPLSQLSVLGLNHWLPTVAAIACGFLGVTAAVLLKQDFINMALAAQQARAARRAERQERERLSDSGANGEAANDEESGKRNGTEQLAGATRQAAAGGEPAAGTQPDQQKEQALVDTSALIDGRIADIAQTGFVTGALIVPRFVLEELQHIADSEDALRRARGRRGLSVISRLQKEDEVSVEIPDADVKSVHEVDAKLVKLALLWHCPIITGDFNLNQVAKLQGVKVLNINELAHALKPLMLPGEELPLQIIHEGKEAGQGVGYLDDGTMIVVHGGKPYIGTTVDVTVTRVLQTVAGRMIFAQPKQGLGAVGISTTNSGRRAEA